MASDGQIATQAAQLLHSWPKLSRNGSSPNSQATLHFAQLLQFSAMRRIRKMRKRPIRE
jgi:hypothetical protein